MQTDKINVLKVWGREKGYPIIKDEGAEFLQEIIKEKQPTKILEIGTAIGYSGILMLSSSNAHLTTLELNKTSCEIASRNFKEWNLSERVKIINGDAGEIIKSLNETFDFIFLDGPKGQYVKYLPRLIELMEPNATLVADNVLFRGYVLSPNEPPKQYRTLVRNLRQFLNNITQNDILKSEIYDISDGISLSMKIGGKNE